MPNITEKNLTAQSLIDWLQAEGYEYKPGPALGFGQPEAEREDSQFRDVVLKGRLLGAVRRLNPQLPPKQAQAVVDEIAAFTHADLVLGNKQVYGWLSDGYKKEWRENGEEKFELVKLVDYEHPEANDFLVSDEVTVRGIDTLCRFDVIGGLEG